MLKHASVPDKGIPVPAKGYGPHQGVPVPAKRGTSPPNPPALPVFPGSTEVDWMSSQLGLLSRGHYRMLDDLLSPIGRHLVPVSVAIFFYSKFT